MKSILLTLLLLSQAVAGLAASNQLFDHLRALGENRLPVGAPGVTVTNRYGARLDGPKDIAAADLDGDGHADFAAANKDGTVTVYFGAGDGTFSPPTHLRTWTNSPADHGGLVIERRLTNDCVNYWTNFLNGTNYTNGIWACVSGPTTVTTQLLSLADGPTGLRGLALADFTGDGKRDIAVASPGEAVIYLLVNQGGRSFAAATRLNAWLGVRDLAAGDFDGDGQTDLAASGTTNGVAQYRALGGGQFQVMTNMASLGTAALDEDFPQPAFYLRAFRPSGSTRDELVISRAQGGEVRVLAANSQGRLEVQNTLNEVRVHALDTGSLLQTNGSGVIDLVSVDHGDGVVEIRAGRSDSRRFETNVTTTISVPGRAHGIAVADLDQDGWNDLIVVLQNFAKVRVLRNNQGSFETASELPVGAGPRELATADFNGDGRPDAAILNRDSEDVSILLAHPTQFGFGSLDMLYPADGEVVALQVYDFNDDGRDDVVQIHRAAGELSVRLARADGTLSEPVFYGLGSQPSDTRVVDLNNDGHGDIIAVDLRGFVTARLGVGNGTFGPEIRTDLSVGAETSWGGGQLFSVTTGDFNGDGFADLAAGYLDCRVGLFQGHGDGSFTHTHTHPLGYETHGLATGDFNGDGIIDLVATPWDGSLIVVRNHGDLLTTDFLDRMVIPNPIANGGAWTVVVTDYNQDGDIDLLVDGSLGYSLYLGGPGYLFTWTTNIVSRNISAALSPVMADFNQDGNMDIAAACVDRSCVSFALGKTGGGFEEPFFISTPSSGLIAAGDIDGDGLPDLVGTGEVLWTALSSRGPQPGLPPPAEVARSGAARPVINELLAANDALPIAADGNRNTDYVELFNSGSSPLALLNWKLRLEQTNAGGFRITNVFVFPTNAILDASNRLLLVCSANLRSPLHTGFNLPAEGGTLLLVRADGSVADKLDYGPQQPNRAYARFQDGVNGFVVSDTPTPGTPNVNTGLNPPKLSIESLEWESLQPDQPIRFFARASDDLGIVNLSLLWRRLDVKDEATKRVILYDDGQHQDLGVQDGYFSGVLQGGLPAGGEIQFYLECTDVSGKSQTAPGSPRFVSGGQTPLVHTLALPFSRPALEISEVLARNVGGLQDETGGTPDWIEIRNCSTQNVSLAGVSLAQKLFGNSGRMSLTNGTLAPGEHLILFADSQPQQSAVHAPFKLNRDGDELFLCGETPNGARFLIDAVRFGRMANNVAWSRLGCAGPWTANAPTPRTGNVAGAWYSAVNPDGYVLAYPTRPGARYTVEYKADLNTAHWTPLPTTIGAGLEQTVTWPRQGQIYFRVREEP